MKRQRLARVQAIASFAMAIMLSTFAGSCSNDHDPEDDGNHRCGNDGEEKPYVLTLSFGGDYVEQSEEPLMRAASSSSYAGINVTRRAKDNPNASVEKYAYGVYTDKENITITLYSGYTYDFEATILTDNTDKFCLNTTLGKGYITPFSFKENSTTPILLPTGNANRFHYNQEGSSSPYEDPTYYLYQISSGVAFVDINDNKTTATPANYANPRVHRFYGTLNNVDPNDLAKESKPIEIDMKYKCFGLSIDASSIPDDTTVTWYDKNFKEKNDVYQGLVFPETVCLPNKKTNAKEWGDIYSVTNLTSDDPFELTLHFDWDRGMGEVKQFEATVSVRPGIRKILKIVFEGGANTRFDGNIILKEESTDLEDVWETVNSNQ